MIWITREGFYMETNLVLGIVLIALCAITYTVYDIMTQRPPEKMRDEEYHKLLDQWEGRKQTDGKEEK
jgi:hypothetical protein